MFFPEKHGMICQNNETIKRETHEHGSEHAVGNSLQIDAKFDVYIYDKARGALHS